MCVTGPAMQKILSEMLREFISLPRKNNKLPSAFNRIEIGNNRRCFLFNNECGNLKFIGSPLVFGRLHNRFQSSPRIGYFVNDKYLFASAVYPGKAQNFELFLLIFIV